MSPHQVIAVAVRLFAIWLAVHALRTASALLSGGAATFPRARLDGEGLVLAAIISFLTLAVAALLWFFPLTVAKKLLSAPATPSAPAEAPGTWFATGCTLIGVWMLGSAVPVIVRDAFYFHSSYSEYGDTEGFKPWFAWRCVEVVIALWLIFGANGFAKSFAWLRTAGTRKAG
jgi:hypothetical protein